MARGDGADADGPTDLPAALPGPSTAADPFGLLAPSAPSAAANTNAGQPDDGAPSRASARGAAAAARAARVGTPAGPTSSNSALASPDSALASPDSDITITPTAATAADDPAGLDAQEPSPATRSVVPPGFDLQLNASAAVLVPTADTNPTSSTSPGIEPTAPPASAEPRTYKYDDPAVPATPTGASGLSGVADWAWAEPTMEAPAAPADGSLVPDSAAAGPLGDPVVAAAAAMPSVVRAAADPASWDLGRGGGGRGGGSEASADGGRASGKTAPARLSVNTSVSRGGGCGGSAASAGAVGGGGRPAAAGLSVNTSNSPRDDGSGDGSTVGSPRSPGLGSWSPNARSSGSSGGSPRIYNPFGAVSSRSMDDAHAQEDGNDDGRAIRRWATYSGTGNTAAAGSVGVGGGAGSVVDGVLEPAEVAALLPDVPGDLEVAAQGPGLEGTAEVTRVAVAAIAAPRYITPLPPHLIDIAREPSAWDLAGP